MSHFAAKCFLRRDVIKTYLVLMVMNYLVVYESRVAPHNTLLLLMFSVKVAADPRLDKMSIDVHLSCYDDILSLSDLTNHRLQILHAKGAESGYLHE